MNYEKLKKLLKPISDEKLLEIIKKRTQNKETISLSEISIKLKKDNK